LGLSHSHKRILLHFELKITTGYNSFGNLFSCSNQHSLHITKKLGMASPFLKSRETVFLFNFRTASTHSNEQDSFDGVQFYQQHALLAVTNALG